MQPEKLVTGLFYLKGKLESSYEEYETISELVDFLIKRAQELEDWSDEVSR